MRKKTKVVHRKLGREKADGLAYKGFAEIHIDERLSGKNYLLTAIHELLHIHRPELTEEEVVELSESLCDDLWELKIRRIDQ